jgi:hypothetical protein
VIRKATFLPIVIFFTTIIFGCGEEKQFHKHASEGVIEYEVTYPELDSNNIMLEMLPSKMIMTFKKDKFKSELKTAAGIIEMSVIADYSSQKMYNLVKIFSDKYVLEMNKSEALLMTATLPPFQIERQEVSTEIAEASCEKLILNFGSAKKESYTFYETSEVDFIEPNWCTPFHEIKGVLLDYRVENYGMNMRLRAIRIIPGEVEDSEFDIDEDYEDLSPEEFNDLVVRNMEIFME